MTLVRLLLSTSATSALLALTAAPALAQADQPAGTGTGTGQPAAQVDEQNQTPPSNVGSADQEQGESIIVTGSRIPRANFDTAQPAVVLGRDQIEQRGYTNLGDALEELPAFGVPGNNQVGAQSGAFGSGQVFVNFFGLGDQRTLTVVNGRRFVSSNTSSIFGPTGAGSQVDFNTIPTLIVDRVETIAVGGAPIYGSDAIAGTVNIITLRRFNGVRVDAQMGISERGDAERWRVGGLVGTTFLGDRGSILAAGEYVEEDGLTGASRPNSGLGRFFTTCPPGTATFQQCLIEDRALPSLSQFGVPLVSDFIPLTAAQAAAFGGYQPSVVDAQGRPLAFDVNGNLVPIDFGQATGNFINFNGGSGFRLPENLFTPVRRIVGTVLAEYRVTDRVRLFAEGWYANSRGTQLRDQPVYNTALFDAAGTPDGNLIIDINNPFLTPGARAIIQQNLLTNPNRDVVNQDFFYVGRANTDLITGEGSSEVELFRGVAGIDGTFDAFGRDLTFELVGVYGRSTTQGNERVLVQQNFENALNAVRDANGNIVCAPGQPNAPIQTVSSTCAPINPFGQQISQAARDYVTAIADPRAENDQWVVTASVSGNLFRLWGDPIGFAVGYEHREESASFDPGLFYAGQVDPANPTGDRIPFGRSVPIDAVAGDFHTNEFFGELTVPVIGREREIPLIYSLELNGAVRYIMHSNAGNDPTYTIGARWQPIRDIAFRGNFTRSVRAPAVTELFNPTSQIFTTADDPCDSRFRNAGPNPTQRAANCTAAGLPANFQSNIVDFTSRGSLAGNPNLQNEIANAWTVGAVLRPRFLPGFTLAVDWVDIELQQAVVSLDATQTLEACYDAPSFPTDICSRFTRDAAGQVTFVSTGFANASSTLFRGLVAELAWRLPTPFLGADSSINLGVNYLYNDTLETRVGFGDLSTASGSIGYSRHQFTANTTYSNGPFTWQVQTQFIGPALFDPDEAPNTRDIAGVDSVAFVNSSMAYRVSDNFTFRIIVDNLFDTAPPFPAPGGGGRVTYFPGLLGRYFKVGASIRF